MTDTAAHEPVETLPEEALIRGLSRRLPGPVGPLLATVVALVSFAIFLWSLIATWSEYSQYGPPLFQTIIATGIVGTLAIYARKTFAYVIALVAGAAWLIVSVLPLVNFVQVLLQAIIVTVLVFGAVIAIVAVHYDNHRYDERSDS